MLSAARPASRSSAGSSALAGSWSGCRCPRRPRAEGRLLRFWEWRSCIDGRGRFGALTQHELLDLAGRGLRQLAEHDGARRLEAREVPAAELDQLGFADRGVALQLDESARRFTPLRIRLGDHRGGEHGGMAIENV